MQSIVIISEGLLPKISWALPKNSLTVQGVLKQIVQAVGWSSCVALRGHTLQHPREMGPTRTINQKECPQGRPSIRKNTGQLSFPFREQNWVYARRFPLGVEDLHRTGSVAFQNCCRLVCTISHLSFFWPKVSAWLLCPCPTTAHSMWEYRKVSCLDSLQVITQWRATCRCEWRGQPRILDFELISMQNGFLVFLLGESVSMFD